VSRISVRQRVMLALGLLAVMAIAGQLVLNQAATTLSLGEGKPRTILTFGFDFFPFWYWDRFFTLGHGLADWYGKAANAYPPPHEVLMAPFSYLPRDAAQVVSIVGSAVLMGFVVWLWARPGDRGGLNLTSGAWPILLSAPVFAVVVIDQFQAAFGLAALSLALWAQRRNYWWLVGPAAGLGLIRTANAIPILAILLIGGWGKWRQLAIAIGSTIAVFLPLVLISFAWDPHWPAHYVTGIALYPSSGAPKVASGHFGYWGLALLAIGASLLAVLLVWRDRGRPLDAGRSALGMALTLPITPLSGLYSAVFVLPAILQLGLREPFRIVPWIAAFGPWAVILAVSPVLLGPSPFIMLTDISLIDFVLLALTYPLLRLPPVADESRQRLERLSA
jgi:Glycosyltransferase family 87